MCISYDGFEENLGVDKDLESHLFIYKEVSTLKWQHICLGVQRESVTTIGQHESPHPVCVPVSGRPGHSETKAMQ